jgi:hypothetical protein
MAASSTTMKSACRIVLKRWAMTTMVAAPRLDQFTRGLLNVVLRDGVKSARRLVEDPNGRLPRQGATRLKYLFA